MTAPTDPGQADSPLTVAILGLWWGEELDHDDLLWSVYDGKVAFAAACSDFFDWGSADCEEIDEAGLPVLVQAVAECKAVDEVDWSPRLYAARRRAMRPQGAYYKHIPEVLWTLFDACGPSREVGLGNPTRHPGEATA